MSNLFQTYFTFLFLSLFFFFWLFDNVSAIRFMLSLVKYHNCFITIFLKEKTGKTYQYKHYLQSRHANKPFLLWKKKLTTASLYWKSIRKEWINLILTPRHRRSSCSTARRRRANSLGLSSSALLLLSASSSLCPLFTLCCSSLVALSKRKALCSRQVAVRAKYILKTQSSTISITINEATP